MKHLTRRDFGKAVAGGIGALSVPISFAFPTLPAASAASSAQPSAHSLENRFGISLRVEPEAGLYSVRYQGERWLGTGLASVLENRRWYRSADVKYPEASAYLQPQGKLLLTDMKTGRSEDHLGSYESIDLTWKVPDSPTDVVTGFRLYSEAPCLVFVQNFPHGFKKYASGNWIVPSVAFPQFLPDFEDRNDLYSWTSGGMFTHRFAYGNAASQGGTVDLLLLADSACHALVLSPFGNYLAATQQLRPWRRWTKPTRPKGRSIVASKD